MIFNANHLRNKDLLVICPTRERPQKLHTMYSSYLDTSRNSDIILCVDVDDPTEYSVSCPVSVEPHKNNTKIINDIFNKYPNYEYYMVINDDIVFITQDWDIKLMKEGINFPEDGTGRGFPTFSVIDGAIPRRLGWLQMPRLEYLYGDTVWEMLGRLSRKLKYCPNVKISHPHVAFGGKEDVISKKTNSQWQYDRDRKAFVDWMNEDLFSDLKKVNEVYGQS